MAGLLGDVLPWAFSQGDRAKRYLGGLLADPIGSMQQTAGLLQDYRMEDQQLNARAFADQSQPFRVTDKRAMTQLADRAMAGPLGFAPAGITAWHGTPHVFDKFDSSKIGAGEGQQAYGHGLYLAESKDVAQSYSGKLASELSYNGKPMNRESSRSSRDSAAWALYLAGGDKEAAKASGLALPQMIDKLDHKKLQPGGQVYKVDLPDDAVAKMLDWDKPLSQQSKQVQQALNDYAAIGGVNLAPEMTGRQVYDAFVSQAARRKGYTPNEVQKASAAGSEELRWTGIPGIRYLDGGSRGVGQGTSNFVVFPGEENALKILERNGSPVR